MLLGIINCRGGAGARKLLKSDEYLAAHLEAILQPRRCICINIA